MIPSQIPSGKLSIHSFRIFSGSPPGIHLKKSFKDFCWDLYKDFLVWICFFFSNSFLVYLQEFLLEILPGIPSEDSCMSFFWDNIEIFRYIGISCGHYPVISSRHSCWVIFWFHSTNSLGRFLQELLLTFIQEFFLGSSRTFF